MTGLDFKNLYLTKIDDAYTAYYDDVKLQRFVDMALLNAVEKKLEVYEKTNKVDDDLLPLIIFLAGIALVSGGVDISNISTAAPNYHRILNIKVKYSTATAKVAILKKQFQKIASYGQGTLNYPKYEIYNSTIIPSPAGATSIDLVYCRTPIEIDITNNTNVVPYQDKFLTFVIDEMITLVSAAKRDAEMYQVGNQELIINP